MNKHFPEIAKIVKDELEYGPFNSIYAECFEGFIQHTKAIEKEIQIMFLKDTFTRGALKILLPPRFYFNGFLNADNISLLYDNFEIGIKMIWLSRQEEMKAKITGNILEDEKAGGLHIAYGTSVHLGGKIESDIHQDICYSKGLPIEARSLILINNDGTKTELIKNALLRYKILK